MLLAASSCCLAISKVGSVYFVVLNTFRLQGASAGAEWSGSIVCRQPPAACCKVVPPLMYAHITLPLTRLMSCIAMRRAPDRGLSPQIGATKRAGITELPLPRAPATHTCHLKQEKQCFIWHLSQKSMRGHQSGSCANGRGTVGCLRGKGRRRGAGNTAGWMAS